jgi:hypothetical protein
MTAWTGPYNKPTKAKVTLAFVGLLYKPKSGWAVGWGGLAIIVKNPDKWG